MQYDTIHANQRWAAGFICGLVCGEGSFGINVTKSPSCRIGFHARPVFQLELHRCDEELICSVKAFFGFGSVNYPKPRTRARNESPTCKYVATAITDCEALVRFFTANPLVGAKNRSFSAWSQCIALLRTGRHTSTEGFAEILRLRAGINQTRRPSTFRMEAPTDADAQGRILATWTADELQLVHQYLAGALSRGELVVRLGRSTASVANQITRLRRYIEAQKGQ
jgi:LAGLIDADG endonuclease